MMRLLSGIALSALLAGGCASVPVRYYSLESAPATLATGTDASCCRIVIASVKLPPEVDRPEILVRDGEYELSVLGNELWAAPLREEIKAALTNEIHLGLLALGARRPQADDGVIKISVDIERFDSLLSRDALIEIGWRVAVPGSGHELTASCDTLSRIVVGEGVAALVRGHQQALSTIAATMASGIRNLEITGANGCGGG